METYLAELKRILMENHYSDIDEIMTYFRELLLDAMESGKSEGEAIDELGDVNEVAMTLLGDKKVKINFDDNVLKIKLFKSDLSIYCDNVDDVTIKTNNDNLYDISCEENVYEIIEKKGKLFDILDNAKVEVVIPYNTSFSSIDIDIASGDCDFSGNIMINDLNLKVLSGDVDIDELLIQKASINIISGDIDMTKTKINELNINSVSGDIDVNEHNSFNSVLVTVSGDIDVYKSNVDHLDVKTKSGDIDVCLKGSIEDYHIECNDMADKKIAQRSLKIKTVCGDVNYTFEI